MSTLLITRSTTVSAEPTAQRACGHCADFLSYAYMMQGNLAHARESSGNYEKMTQDPTNTIAVLTRFGRWDEVLALPEPADDGKNDVHNAHAVRGFGISHAGRPSLASVSSTEPRKS